MRSTESLRWRESRWTVALQTLERSRGAGERASGHRRTHRLLLDGLREFPPNEVVMLSGGEAGWEFAGALAERVRAEVGLPVTEVSRSAS